jgi:alkyldihydroxyacetonephosphate synthase
VGVDRDHVEFAGRVVEGHPGACHSQADDDPVAQWERARGAASRAIFASSATITHHHAVGRDHLPYLAAEIGEVGVEILRAVKQRLDPANVMNPGILIP